MRRSVAIVLDTRGSGALGIGALTGLPDLKVVRAEVVRGEQAACLALTLEHEESQGDLRRRLGAWAGPQGWSVTIAPVAGGR